MSTLGATSNSTIFPGGTVPACLLQSTVNQTIGNNVDVDVVFSTAVVNTDNNYDVVNFPSRITFNTAGLYHIGASVWWNTSSVGNRRHSIYRVSDGLVLCTVANGASTVDDFLIYNMSALRRFTVGEQIRLRVHQTSGGNQTVQTSSNSDVTVMQVCWLSS